ncbi:hypothetical protein ACQUW5_07155 [Legionella sp. CNM-1927-20]|uniref:hypothetical protein n=1 Tax=Legionella sp. CNM-1927-20 TaxID=3422221 RepID=UPI00403AA354
MFASQDSNAGREVIKVDIPRAGFLDFSAKRTFLDLEQAWEKEGVAAEDYIQGRITGSVFCELMYKIGVMSGKIVPTSLKESGDFFTHLGEDNQVSLSFAYFNDTGKPCGFSLMTSKSDPGYWGIVKKIRIILEQ